MSYDFDNTSIHYFLDYLRKEIPESMAEDENGTFAVRVRVIKREDGVETLALYRPDIANLSSRAAMGEPVSFYVNLPTEMNPGPG